jgi:hypothetical protein
MRWRLAKNAGKSIFVHNLKGKRWAGDQQVRDEWVRVIKKADNL